MKQLNPAKYDLTETWYFEQSKYREDKVIRPTMEIVAVLNIQ
jgi:hypothetical protein